MFAACYNPVGGAQVDFATGIQSLTYDIVFTKGAVLSKQDLTALLKEQVLVDTCKVFLLCERLPEGCAPKSFIILHREVYRVKVINSSFYANWALLSLETAFGTNVINPEVASWRCSDRTRIMLDWLVTAVKNHYGGGVPDTLILWPIAGFNLTDSLQYIYPQGQSAVVVGDVGYLEIGRKAGYYGVGTVNGLPAGRAANYQQSSDTELAAIIAQFNTYMGRL